MFCEYRQVKNKIIIIMCSRKFPRNCTNFPCCSMISYFKPSFEHLSAYILVVPNFIRAVGFVSKLGVNLTPTPSQKCPIDFERQNCTNRLHQFANSFSEFENHSLTCNFHFSVRVTTIRSPFTLHDQFLICKCNLYQFFIVYRYLNLILKSLNVGIFIVMFKKT